VAPALNPLERALQRIVSELSSVGRSVALVGGLAVSARAEPRTTRDVDLAVSVAGDEDAEQLVFHLQNRGYVVRMLLEREESGRIATIRLTRDTERAIYVDLLFASSGIETEIVNDAEPTEIVEGISVPVATRAHLIALKVLARDDRNRPQDWDDLRALLLDASSQEVHRAREALELIEQRGYNRGRSLSADLDRALVDTKTH
jgi:predicted nucleotidyltransferase